MKTEDRVFLRKVALVIVVVGLMALMGFIGCQEIAYDYQH